MMSKKEATAQQKLFIDEYLKLRKSNQKKAALNAGYSPKSAEAQASQLLKNPRVRAYLDERESQLEKELRKEFMFDALEARKVMYNIMNDEEAPDNVRVSAAKDFLDRAGFKPIEKQEISGELKTTNAFAELTTEELKKLADGYE
jgi:uncharacterized protein (UPF0147 family)